MPSHKARILFVGPTNAGKTKLANFLADVSIELPEEMRPTKALRIVEYDINNVEIKGVPSTIDMQIWDCSGDDKYMSYWSVLRKNADGVVFVYSPEDDSSTRKLDYLFNYFVTQPGISLRCCLVVAMRSEELNTRLSPNFSKLSKITANLEDQSDKVRQEFIKYLTSVIGIIENKK